MTVTFEQGETALRALLEDERSGGSERNEATTRLQIIDRLFFECLGWERHECHAEERFDGDYSDYTFSAPHRLLIAEAKREGVYFELPAEARTPRVRPIRYFERHHPEVFAAVRQCMDYCQQRGAPFGTVANGAQLVAFVASRSDGIAPLDGQAVVFSSLQDMADAFLALWNALSKDGVRFHELARMTSATQSSPPPKLAEALPGYPGYQRRNQIQTELQILGDLLIEDVQRAGGDEVEFLEQCYAPSGALSQYSLLSRAILESRYAEVDRQAEGPSLRPAVTKKGIDKSLIADVHRGRPVLLVGDVGVGKSIFLRHLIKIDAADVLTEAFVLYIDLGSQPILTTDIGSHVAAEIADQLRRAYATDIDERNFIRGVYHGDLSRFRRGIFADIAESDPAAFTAREVEYLASLIQDREGHIRRSLEHIARGRERQLVVILDNVDQRPYEFQQSAFLVANGMAAQWPATVFLTLRPETFYRSRMSGSLSAYHPKAFTISPPRLDVVIEKRLVYASHLAATGRFAALQDVEIHAQSLENYLDVLLQSFTGRYRGLIEFCDNMCGGNIRLALEFIRMFIGSGHVNTQKILEEYQKRERYEIPLHEFLRAVIFGDYEHFDPSRSEIANVFDINTNDGKEHFLVCVIVAFVVRTARAETDGYVASGEIIEFLQNAGYTAGQVAWALDKAVGARLLEHPTRSTPPNSRPEERELTVRATSIGAYYVTRLCRDFTYIDAMIVDTPILGEARGQIHSMPTASVTDRVDRAEAFRRYMDGEWGALAERNLPFSWAEASMALEQGLRQVRIRGERAAAR